MSDRETKEITTPAGHKLVLYTYVTGLEKRQLMYPFFREASDFGDDVLKVKGKAGAIHDATQDLALRSIIVSADGKKDDAVEGGPFSLVDWVLSLPASETDFIIKAVNEVTNDHAFEPEKKTS
jgi:hypothetical protein